MDGVKICEVVDGCEDCPKYGDDCDGDKMTEHTDYIRRADAIEAVCEWGTNEERKGNLTTTMVSVKQCVADILSALPSADAVSREWYDDAVKANHELAFTDLPDIPRYYYEKVVGKMAHEINMLKEQLESADDVKVAYICDGRKCDKDCSECFRTMDIEHARDFKRMGDTYYQQESADAEWIDNGIPDSILSKCSNCGYTAGAFSFNFCPNCGARMKGGAE